MPLNEKVIGKKYVTRPYEITARESICYGLSYKDDNEIFYNPKTGGDIIAPPMFAARYAAGPTKSIIKDKETGLNFAKAVYYTLEFEWIKPVKPGDVISNEGEITGIEYRENGSILKWETISKNQNIEVVVKSKWSFFDRSAKVSGAGNPKNRTTETGSILWTEKMKVPKNQTFIYAEAAADYNPIHIDNSFALKAGFPGIILQGLCTMAFTHKVCVNNLCGKDKNPLKLKKLGVNFSNYVLPGQAITFQCYNTGETEDGTEYRIIAKNDKGKHVLKNAYCLID